MTSAQKRKANRQNAQFSTGPKTARGKKRAAQNARRHGLNLSILDDPTRSTELKNLALKIAGEGASPEVLELARSIADAQIDVLRVRQARNRLFARDLSDPSEVTKNFKDNLRRKPMDQTKLAHALSDLKQQLILIDRYERRALSRRKFAIRDFDSARN